MEQNQNQQPPEFNNQPQGYGQPQYGQPQYSQPQYGPPQYSMGKPMMPFWTAVKTCFKKFFDFTGRARRSEYWWFVLFEVIIAIVWSFLCLFVSIGLLFSSDAPEMFLSNYWILLGVMVLPCLLLCFPQYAAMTRRLHDTGRSGWWVVASVILGIVYSGLYLKILLPMNSAIISGEELPQGGPIAVALQDSPGLLAAYGILALASLVLSIIILVFTVQDSHREENKYGPSPKYQ